MGDQADLAPRPKKPNAGDAFQMRRDNARPDPFQANNRPQAMFQAAAPDWNDWTPMLAQYQSQLGMLGALTAANAAKTAAYLNSQSGIPAAQAAWHGADMGYLGNLANAQASQNAAGMNAQLGAGALPWQYATAVHSQVPGAQASMYGSLQNALANMYGAQQGSEASKYGSWANAYASMQNSADQNQTMRGIAHFDPWAQVNSANVNAIGGQNIAGINAQGQLVNTALQNQARQGALDSLMNYLQPLMQKLSAPMSFGINTNYGAGIA